MIKYIPEGNIFALEVQGYAHGCNCAGAMGKGIALQFKNKFPQMYIDYKKLCAEKEFHPGDVFDYKYEENRHIYNLGTQLTWRTKATLENIDRSLTAMCELATNDNVKSIALPAIGAGLGGLKWEDVKTIIDEISARYPKIDLYIVESYSPGV